MCTLVSVDSHNINIAFNSRKQKVIATPCGSRESVESLSESERGGVGVVIPGQHET